MNRARFRHRTLLCSDRSFVPTISRIDAKKEQKGGKKTAEKNENRQEDRRSWAIGCFRTVTRRIDANRFVRYVLQPLYRETRGKSRE